MCGPPAHSLPQDCSVEILPMAETACSEPGATGYNYNNLAIQGYYDSPTTIRTGLPSSASAAVE